ncbi:helix-turn-helix transcriptional regulator [Streptomyces europaeiscabiei]|uniref:helix-turn-helix transcriptional regulator n=1 Tax=Streptomyces europaeiscabiei TaxID=146819 RepID=UPI000765EE4F|nr:AAA family ATPase [Streptomyces europaeiscabiei]MDX2531404.1 AAA family ATPase [Streptomyces europaeiscabiei]MDX3673440.1 AAA family ATPase [Streptomyces europaeiscabiei]
MLWERESELAQATEALRRARSGRGSLLVVRGPLGVGRSSFLEALAALAGEQGALLLRAQASEAEEDFGLGVVRQLVDSALGPGNGSDRWLRDAAASLPEGASSSIPSGPSADSDRKLSAVPSCFAPCRRHAPRWLAAFLGSMSADRPVVLMVDDLQWADTESLQALAVSLARRRQQRILFVFSVLPGDVGGTRQHVRQLLTPAKDSPASADETADRTVELSALGLDSVRPLVEESFGDAADAAFVETVATRSGGSPLLLRALLDEAQYLGLRPTSAHAAIVAALRPERIRQRLAAFLRSQPDHVRRAAYALTVLGAVADSRFVACLAAVDEAQEAEAIDVLRLAGLVDPHSCRLTSGTVLRDLLEEHMPPQKRTAMRKVAAELLHRTGHPAELAAEQFMAASTLRGQRAVRILRTAADSALRRGSPRDSARYLRRALLDGSLSGRDRARLLVDLATAERAFATAASVRHVVEAVPLLDSVVERADAVARLGPLQMAPPTFRIDDVRAEVADTLRRYHSDDWVEQELMLRLEAHEHILSAQDPAHIKRALRRFRDLGPSPRLGTTGERELVTSLMYIAFLANAAPADRLAGLAARLLEQEPPAPEHVHSTIPLAVTVLAAAGRTEGTAGWLHEAYRLAQRRGGDVEQAVIRCEQAVVALADGHPADAGDKVLRADALAGPETSGLPTMCVGALARVALATGEPELARRLLTHHRLDAENQYLTALLHMARGSLAARRNEPRGALYHYRMAGLHTEQIGWSNPTVLPWPSGTALMHHRLGEHDEALAVARTDVDRSRVWGAPAGVGRSLVVLGRITVGQESSECLEEAVAVLEKGSNGYELCRALYALGTHEETGRARRTAALKRAQELATEYGVHSLAKSIREQLTGGYSKGTEQAGHRLTPSERKVAELAAAGLSNSEIASRLGTSSRMVEKHLTRSYRKLDISGRSDLIKALKALGDDQPL